MCQHEPPCPASVRPDREAAEPVARDHVMGWTLLCNGVLCFEDTGEILPNGKIIAPHRPADAIGAAA